MKKKAIILDIDNTIFSQARRIFKVLNVVTNKNLQFDGDLNLSKGIQQIMLLKESIYYNLFYSIFLSDKYYKVDGEYQIDLIKDADKIINDIASRDIEIFYVSARINNSISNHNNITYEMFEHYKIPYKKENIKLLPLDFIPQDSKSFHVEANNFKTQTCTKIANEYDVLFGLGDASSDIEAFNKAKIRSIQARFVLPKDKYSLSADNFINSWEELKEFY